MRPRIGWGLPLVPDPIQSWRFREVYARKSRGPSLHRLGKIDAMCTCIDTSDVKLMEFQSIKHVLEDFRLIVLPPHSSNCLKKYFSWAKNLKTLSPLSHIQTFVQSPVHILADDGWICNKIEQLPASKVGTPKTTDILSSTFFVVPQPTSFSKEID